MLFICDCIPRGSIDGTFIVQCERTQSAFGLLNTLSHGDFPKSTKYFVFSTVGVGYPSYTACVIPNVIGCVRVCVFLCALMIIQSDSFIFILHPMVIMTNMHFHVISMRNVIADSDLFSTLARCN